jgi:PAS domain S-box-containing protein
MITDLNAQIEYASARLCELTGYSEQELVGKNVRIFQSGMTDPAVYRQLWNTISIGGEWQGELQNRKKNGELYWESVNISPIFDSAGVMVNYLAVKEDITERKRSMALLEEAKKKAEAADRLKTAFLENISHEIRTPLNGLLGFAPIVLDPAISQKEKEEYLEILNVSGKRLMQTVTDYVDMSLLVSGNMKASFKNVNVCQLVEEAVLPYYDKCRHKGISLMINMESSLTRLPINTDSELFKKALSHLLDNAIKFTHHGGVTLEGKIESGNLKISVIDTGIGIESDALFNIFDKFFQEDNNRTRNFEGSGLGLAIVTEILKLLGGNIGAISKKHLGSRFSFNIPFREVKTER